MNLKKSLSIICFSSWCGLGFFRGTNYYKYKKKEKENYLYINSAIHGFFGAFIYANPCFLPITVYKEIYRLEINLRNLENEKNKDFYDLL